jgi:hypothetical protein
MFEGLMVIKNGWVWGEKWDFLLKRAVLFLLVYEQSF